MAKKKYIRMKNADVQLVADILTRNSSKTGRTLGNAMFGGNYWETLKIDPKAFKILTEKDKKILKDPKYYPLYYAGEMCRTDTIYKEDVKRKLKDVL